MFYSFARGLIRILLWLFNGNTHYENKEAIPDGPYVLVGPHRTWWDPIIFALAASPRKFAFMAKAETFHNPIIGWIIGHANGFPVDRAHPGPSAIKTPVKILRKGELSLIMFPTGSRYSSEMKGGATMIAKMAKVPIVPAVYQGPLSFGQLFLRKRITVRFGAPIQVPAGKLNDELFGQVNQLMEDAFTQLDYEIDPNFKYVPNTEKYEKEKSSGKV
jgi:1-acyl-sn-glycerol-3-phosphate acyltransferase